MDNPKIVGSAIGLIVGVVLVWQGAFDALIVALFVVGGWIIGKYLAGEIPILDALLERFVSSRRDSGE